MENYNNDTEVDFLDELSPLSAPMVDTPAQLPIAYADLPLGSFITISFMTCFKRFETRSLNGIGDANTSRTLGQIRQLSCFRDLCTIVWDNSNATQFDTRKKNFFFGKRTNQQVALEYCTLSFIETEECIYG